MGEITVDKEKWKKQAHPDGFNNNNHIYEYI